MKNKLFFIGFLFCFSMGFSQVENNKKTLNISVPLPQAPLSEKPISTPSFFQLPTEKKKNSLFNIPEKEIDFLGKEKFLTRKFELPKNVTGLPEKNDSQVKVNKADQYFGDFFTDGGYFNVYCRDHSAIDGDLINILLNDEIIFSNVYLTADFQGFNVPLKTGFNKIEIQAINQGESPPNTAQFMVVDHKGSVLINEQWGLATGYKARFILIKE